MKVCRSCGNEKEEKSFGKWSGSKDGLHCYCRECISEKGKESRLKDPERYREKTRIYREKNPEKWKETQNKTYQKHKERKKAEQKEYYWKNRDVILKKDSERKKRFETKMMRREYYEKNRAHLAKITLAHRIVAYAIRLGVLERPEICENCGVKSQIIDGHHEDYMKPLDVRWVCRKCHREIEKL